MEVASKLISLIFFWGSLVACNLLEGGLGKNFDIFVSDIRIKWILFNHLLRGGLWGLNVMMNVGWNLGLLGMKGQAWWGYTGLGFSRSTLSTAKPLCRFSSTISVGYPLLENLFFKFSTCLTMYSGFEQINFTVSACPYTMALKTLFGWLEV